jgi:hypothetical protein
MSVVTIEWKQQTKSRIVRHDLCLHYLPLLTLRQMARSVRNAPPPAREDMAKLCLAQQLLTSERMQALGS